MTHLNVLVEQQVRRFLNVSETEFEFLKHPSPEHLHDPFYYKDMRELVMYLHQFKQKQEKDERLILMIDGDYDTDGVCASVILAAALSVFGFHFCVYIPTMEDGYGLSKTAVDKMIKQVQSSGQRIGMILTADNGIKAFSGISYAKSLGIDVLVTDHHPSNNKELPKAKAIVDANRPGDMYPFKGNSGACVAWKAMLAYAELFQKDEKPLIERLIVFAGISNVADVMPLRGENRYTVVAALAIIKDMLSKSDYKEIADTPYEMYNTVFYGLYDLITLLQESKDNKRRKEGKNPIPLPMNEELIGWYLSPLINAPRRVHDTCLEGLSPFLTSDTKVRQYLIKRLIELNDEKSKLTKEVLHELPPNTKQTVICANTRKGISGLIAGELLNNNQTAAVVFSCYNPENPNKIYTDIPNIRRLTGSARSNASVPLDRILTKINTQYPDMISGGGHETAAGFSIDAKNYETFKQLFDKFIPEVYNEVLKEESTVIVPANVISLTVTASGMEAKYQILQDGKIALGIEELNTETLKQDTMETIRFLESLRPFGRDFEANTKIHLVFDNTVLNYHWNPNFWKTFKFDLFGVEVLTFDEEWSDKVKQGLETGNTITASVQLKINNFRGTITPQMILKPEE